MTVVAFGRLADRNFRSENPYYLGRKVFLAGAELDDGVHAAYPDAERTLCGLLARAGRSRDVPTCPACVATAIAFDEIDCSVPDHWRPDYVAAEERQEAYAA